MQFITNIFTVSFLTQLALSSYPCRLASEVDAHDPSLIEGTFLTAKTLSDGISHSEVALGEGSFGQIILKELAPKEGQNSGKSISAAVKVAIPDSDEYHQIQNEIKVLQEIAPMYVLYLPINYHCVRPEASSPEALIFMERLDTDLFELTRERTKPLLSKSLEAKLLVDKLFIAFNDHDVAVRIGLLLHTALSVAALNKEGVVHLDIKTENFLIKQSALPLIKLADFGTSFNTKSSKFTPGNFFGTMNSIDPDMFTAGYEPSSASDVYSLGATLIESVFSVYVTSNRINSDPDFNLKVAKSNSEKLIAVLAKPQSALCSGEKEEIAAKRVVYCEYDSLLRDMFKQMVQPTKSARATMNGVLVFLYVLTRLLDEKSPYLPENSSALFEKAYGTKAEEIPMPELANDNEMIEVEGEKVDARRVAKQAVAFKLKSGSSGQFAPKNLEFSEKDFNPEWEEGAGNKLPIFKFVKEHIDKFIEIDEKRANEDKMGVQTFEAGQNKLYI